MKITPIAKKKKVLPNGKWYGITKCGFSIDHENQNILLKWRKQESKDESAYLLDPVSEFSYIVHCKVGILAFKYESEYPFFFLETSATLQYFHTTSVYPVWVSIVRL